MFHWVWAAVRCLLPAASQAISLAPMSSQGRSGLGVILSVRSLAVAVMWMLLLIV